MDKKYRYIIGISGLICVGKSTFVKILLENNINIEVVSFRNFFSEKMAKDLVPITRKNLELFSANYRQKHGNSDVFKKMLNLTNKTKTILVDGIRTIEAASWFSSLTEKYLSVYIKAPFSLRSKRLMKRESDINISQLQEFDSKLLHGGLNDLLNSSDFIIDNSGSINEFYKIAIEFNNNFIN
jgi:dephospho-CoA kinase